MIAPDVFKENKQKSEFVVPSAQSPETIIVSSAHDSFKSCIAVRQEKVEGDVAKWGEDLWKHGKVEKLVFYDIATLRNIKTIQELSDILVLDATDLLNVCG